jgi:hypothetical protein
MSEEIQVQPKTVGESTKTHHERLAELKAVLIDKRTDPEAKQLMGKIVSAPNATALAVLCSEIWESVEHLATRSYNEIQVEAAMALFNYEAEISPDTLGVEWEDIKTMMGDGFDEWVAKFTDELKTGKGEDDHWDTWFPCKEFWSSCRYPLAEAVAAMKEFRRWHGKEFANTQKLFKMAESIGGLCNNIIYQIAIGQRHYDEQKTEALRALLVAVLQDSIWASRNHWVMSALQHESGVPA